MRGESTLVLRWTTLVLAAFVVQIGVLVDVQPFGVHPDAMLLLAICAGLVGGPTRGAVVGFAAGLLADVMLPGALGISALTAAATGFAVGSVQDAVLSASRTLAVVITAVASAIGVLLYALLTQLLGQRSLADPRLLQIVGIVSVLNAVLCVPVLGLSRWAEGDHVRVGVR